ncbi:unnamed protein product, partial [Ilex paraguariensis]
MLPFSSIASAQIRYLLQSLNEYNSDSVLEELFQYIRYGVEGSILLLQTCLDHLNIYGKDLKNMQMEPVFTSIVKFLFDKPNFSTVLCESLKSTAIDEDFLGNFCNALCLSASEKVGVGLALSDSERLDVRLCGKNFCMAQIGELCDSHVSIDSAEQIQNVLIFLNRSEGLSKHVDSFMQMVSLVQLKEGTEFILAPLLSNELHEANFLRNLDIYNDVNEDDFDALLAEMEKEMSMADIMKELGYGCTVDVSQCEGMLSIFLPLTEVTVARILGTIACTHMSLEDNHNTFLTFCSALGSSSLSDLPLLNSWNIEVLIDSIMLLASGINWINVIENLDHEGFYVPNEAAFFFLMSVYRYVCQDAFPLHAVCGSVWKNSEGQLSFLKYAVSVPPEVFTFAHSGRQLAYIDAVNGHKFQLGHANHAWLCLDLLEVLCQLAERGHASSVRALLEYPLKYCPEILLLGMAHINTAYNLIQYEVSSAVFSIVLKNASGNGMVLHLWHVNPNILLRGFIDAVNIDPENMNKVVDVSQELKILSPALDMVPFSFGIRLAALASQKDLLDLEKWLSTNLSTYKDIFFEECLNFLKEVQYGIQDVSANHFSQTGALWNIYYETSSTFLKVLQAHRGFVSSSQLSKEMEKLHVTFMHANLRLKNGAGTGSSTADGCADDIEVVVNSYFHQMFSGQLAINAMIEMLVRFKESSEKREQSIFECMIANLFEEYNFFSKYPERQLKIAAVLFGSLIKHQLVNHLTLGIALRAVLDALRKPADSKMFAFGTKALEQFVDRLIEWPQYCNHILQISHLRGTHSELVALIERALARISSGYSESDLGHTAVADQHHGSVLAAVANVEMSASSFPSIGSGGSHPGSQLSSPIQLQQKHQNALDERHETSVTSPNYVKPVLPPAGRPSAVSPSGAVIIQKSQSLPSGPAVPSSSPGFTRASRAIASARFGAALNIETLIAAAERRENPVEAPASEIQDKLSFIINNLSATNIEAKAKEFTEILKEQYYPWFAQYMVMKRASIEYNFHDLYVNFMDKVNSKPLNKEILQATYENCKVLLGSELTKSSSEERSLLKNLGTWLGKITISKNQVLRAQEIDPKSLIIEAYEKGFMIAVIPFISKVLESCHCSLAYQPPNPWTMGILGLLVEIYVIPNLKMCLKYEIELLFRTIGVDMKGVTPTCLLKDTVRVVEGNPDFWQKDDESSQTQMVGEVKSGIISALNQVELPVEGAGPSHPGGHSRVLSQYGAPLHLSSGTLMEDVKLAALGLSDQLPSAQGFLQAQSPFSLPVPASNIEHQVVVNPKLHALGLYLHFQSVLPITINRAIKEIVSSIVQCSVSIATQTTKELVCKDYAMESDETRIRNAAHLMVASLAGSLAHVTCKEPLRGSISSQLRNLLQGLNIATELLEQAVQLVINDNLDLGCALIEKAATEKAIQTIDGEITQQLSIRSKHMEGVGPTFFDGSPYIQGHMGILPDALRTKPGCISQSQQRVYEDFVRLPWQNLSNQSSNAVPVGASSSTTGGSSRAYGSASGQLNPGICSSGLGNEGLGDVAQPLDLVSEDLESTKAQLHSVSASHFGIGDSVSLHNFECDTTSFPLASSTELPSVELSNVFKDAGVSVQPLPPSLASECLGSNISEPSLTTGDALDNYQIISEKLKTLLANEAKEAEIQGVIAEVPEIILRCLSRDEAALAVAQKVFKGLYENGTNGAHVGAHLAILAAIRDVSKLVVKELTSWVIYSDEGQKFDKDITVGLIRSELLNLAEYNVHMTKLLDAGRNKAATEFSISLIQSLVINDSRAILELHNLVDALAKLAARPGSPESLQQLVEIARNPTAGATALSSITVGKKDTNAQSRNEKATGQSLPSREDYNVADSFEPDPAGFCEQ